MSRLTTIEQFKEWVGFCETKGKNATIYAVPTQNNARHRKKNYHMEMEVVSVKRKYVELRPSGLSRSGMYCPKTGSTQSEIKAGHIGCGGFKFYSDLATFEKELEVSSKLKVIRKTLHWGSGVVLNDKQIEQIHEILTVGEW